MLYSDKEVFLEEEVFHVYGFSRGIPSAEFV